MFNIITDISDNHDYDKNGIYKQNYNSIIYIYKSVFYKTILYQFDNEKNNKIQLVQWFNLFSGSKNLRGSTYFDLIINYLIFKQFDLIILNTHNLSNIINRFPLIKNQIEKIIYIKPNYKNFILNSKDLTYDTCTITIGNDTYENCDDNKKAELINNHIQYLIDKKNNNMSVNLLNEINLIKNELSILKQENVLLKSELQEIKDKKHKKIIKKQLQELNFDQYEIEYISKKEKLLKLNQKFDQLMNSTNIPDPIKIQKIYRKKNSIIINNNEYQEKLKLYNQLNEQLIS